MTGLQAALWGLLGSGVGEALNLSASTRPTGPRRKWRRPWRRRADRPVTYPLQTIPLYDAPLTADHLTATTAAPPPHPTPHWLPGLLTTAALVLTCLTTAAAQGVLPAPWIDRSPSGQRAARASWEVAGELRPAVGEGMVVFSPSERGRLLAVGADGVEAWDVRDAARPRMAHRSRVPETGPVSALGIDADRFTVLAMSDGQLVTWRPESGVLPRLESTPEVRNVKALRKRTASLDLVVRRSRSLTVLQEAATDGSVREGFMTTASFSEGAHAAQFSPDGNTLALADDLGNVQLWDLSRNYEPTPKGRALNTGARLPRALAFSPDAALLAVIGKDDVVRLWDIGHPDRPRHLGNPVRLPVRSLAFSADSRLVATVGADGRVALWWR